MLWRKFRLLLWKNWLIQRRHPWQTALEVLLPVLSAAVLVLLRCLVEVQTFAQEVRYPAVPIDTLDALRNNTFVGPIDFRLVYSPQHPVLDAFVANVAADLQLTGFVAAANDSELERIVLTSSNYLAGIEFDVTETYESGMPQHLRYALRFPAELRTHHRQNPMLFNWQTDKSITANQEPGPRCRYDADGGVPPGYLREGFLPLQHAIARRFLLLQAMQSNSIATSGAFMPDVTVRRYPHPAFRMDMLISGLESVLPIILVVSFIYPCINITKVIALEKERQLKETMQIMGLPGWLHWAGWAVRAMLPLTVSSALIVGLLKVHWSGGDAAVLSFSGWTVLMAYMAVYCVATVAFCFMMSVFFARANVAAAIAGLVWFGLYLVYQFVDPDVMPLWALLVLCLLLNTGMALGCLLILRFEAAGQGSQWTNLFQTYSVDNDLTVGHVMLMMLVTAALYLLIALYVEQIRPGEFGVPRAWYFPVQRQFWWPDAQKRGTYKKEDEAVQTSEDFEAPCEEFAGVQICGLEKWYGRAVAVQPMRLDMYENQITVLLGHNGAGKTTTMSMLTGMITPTAGTALVNGFDIRRDIGAVRRSLGLCPQHNILFDDLTVREHLEFFTRLKGMRDAAMVERETEKYLRLIGLSEKADTRSAALSGGMKRKLAVCMAFCGGSKVVFCDEPSAGMDPAARRSLWEFIRQERRGRTVLLSTHFMDEADVLGDRIAILNAGELKCCGSAYFLKKRFGVGYHLVCARATNASTAQHTEALVEMLLKYSPDVVLAHENHAELSFRLPDAMQAKFEPLFLDLEQNHATYGLRNFGISLTTLEDVFMNVGSDNAAALPDKSADDLSVLTLSTVEKNGSTSTLTFGDEPSASGLRLWLTQTGTLFRKRYLQTIRSWPLFLIQLLIPVVFVVATVFIERSQRHYDNLPRLPVDLDMYDTTVTLLQNGTGAATNFQSQISREFNRQYADLVRDSNSGGWFNEHNLEGIDEDIGEHILRLSGQQLVEVNRYYYVGAHITPDGSQATAWFNNQPYHAVPLALSLVHNAIVRAQLGGNFSIAVTNAPLPYTTDTQLRLVTLAGRMGITLGINLAFALAFVMAFFALPVVREQANRAKLLQLVCGAKVSVYWGTAFVWDWLVLIGISILLVAALAAFGEKGWSTGVELGRVLLLLVAFGYAALPVTYMFSRLFVVPTAAYTIVSIANVLAGVVLPIAITALMQYNQRELSDTLAWIFQVLPHFALNTCMRHMQNVTQRRRVCEVMCDGLEGCDSATKGAMCAMSETCCDFEYFTMQRPGMGTPLVYLAAVGTVVMAVHVMVEMRWFEALWYAVRPCEKGARDEAEEPKEVGSCGEDADVLDERHRVNNMSMFEIRSQSVVLREVTKVYGKFRAVDRLSVAIDSAECFGLLGINGAGKTSTFKMLTGDLSISSGHAWVRGIPLRTRMNSVHQLIGYCPQFDALIDEMTCRETLHLFCRLRGIPAASVANVVQGLAAELNFVRHLDKQVRACSGGNRRKVSTAVALIGRPQVVYLDEPTTGMDPGAKRHLWDVLNRQRRAGTAIVLTSHSMDECEALCTRLAIMVNGTFRCLGSVQHLKSKFARGYTLMVNVKRAAKTEAMTKVKEFVQETFDDAVLQNQFDCLLTYYVPSGVTRKWSTMFGIMNAAKGRLSIDDYALSQTSLEQVFLSFTELQTEHTPRTRDAHDPSGAPRRASIRQ